MALALPKTARGKAILTAIVLVSLAVIGGIIGLSVGLTREVSSSSSASESEESERGANTTAPPTPVAISDIFVFERVTLNFTGPETAETANPNPFTDYRLDCEFTHAETNDTLVYPGFFNADGEAQDTDAEGGSVWSCRFSPPRQGTWTWEVSFYAGPNVATGEGLSSAERGVAPDGETGSFTVGAPPDSLSPRDNRLKGFLRYVNKNHQQYDNGDWFIGGGTDSPEGLLHYTEFSGTPNRNGRGRTWEAHIQDWNEGDPTWAGGEGGDTDGQGKGIIGAINYLASKGLNSISFLSFSYLGVDGGVYPTIGNPDQESLRYDVSKLAQWEVVFDHMEKQGMMLHIKLGEVQAVRYHDNGDVGIERLVYYREMVSRFGHHLALNWNLGEELANDKEPAETFFITEDQIRSYGNALADIDQNNHLIMLHTWPTEPIKVPFYEAVIADGNDTAIRGFSMQGHTDIIPYYEDTRRWIQQSNNAGVPKVVTSDEQGPFESGILNDELDPGHFLNRTGVLWPPYMAGGAGHQTYFGFNFPESDIDVQDFRGRDEWFTMVGNAVVFFTENDVPFWNMETSPSKTANGQFVLYLPGSHYVIQIVNHFAATLDLGNDDAAYSIRWFDPIAGGALQEGTVTCVSGGGFVGLGNAPGGNWEQDWIVLLSQNDVCEGAGNPYGEEPCLGGYFVADSPDDGFPADLDASVSFSLQYGGERNPAGLEVTGETGLCQCGGERVSFTTDGNSMGVSCAKTKEVPDRACVPSLTSVNGVQCGL